MLFSIIVPCYNSEKYINRCVDSVLAQNFSDCEIILVNDGSQDKTGVIIDDYANKHPAFIKAIHKANGGQTSARKAGLEVSTGTFILCVDSDDYLLPNCLFELSLYVRNKKTDLILFGYKDKNGEHFHKLEEGVYDSEKLKEVRKHLLYDLEENGLNFGCVICSLCVKLVLRELLEKALLMINEDVRVGEDALVSFFIMQRAKNVNVIRKVYYFYDIDNGSSTMHSSPSIMLKHYNLLIKTVEDLCLTDDDRVSGMAIYSLYGLVVSYLIKVSNHQDFINFMEEVVSDGYLVSFLKNSQVLKMRLKEKIVLFCIKRRLWCCLRNLKKVWLFIRRRN